MSRRSEFHSQPTQSTPGTSDQPTDLGKRLLRRERLRQKQERRRQLARRSDQGALSECTSRAPLLTGRVKAHRNVVQRNGTSRTRNRRSPAQSVAPRASMATPSLPGETAQNILVLRFANAIFEPIWNARYIDHVQITAAETLGVEARAGYYETAGALRDMVQNHMLQLLCLVAMEPPTDLGADSIRDEKVKVVRSLRRYAPQQVGTYVVRGQYTAGAVSGKPVVGYREEEKVNPNSETETYVALRMLVDNWRWSDVPIYVRVGKRLPKSATEISVHFKRAPMVLFNRDSTALDQNVLVIRIQPDEGISLRMMAKIPGTSLRIEPVKMDFHYGTSFGKASPEAYERLLLDAMSGDPTLFARRDEVEEAWAFIDPIEHAWSQKENAPPLSFYPAGSWGPEEADELLANDGRTWRRL